MLDYIKAITRRKSDVLFTHSGTNDLTNKFSTMKKVKDLVNCVRDLSRNEEIQTGFSSIISRQEKLRRRSMKLTLS